MSKCIFAAVCGFAAGLYYAYSNEDNLDDFYRQTKKAKRRWKKNYHKAIDQICDCMEHD